MTTFRTLFLTLLLPVISYGQDSSSTKSRKFFIGVNFSPDYCYRSLTKNDASISRDQWSFIKNLEDSIYKPTFGYTTGINFYYQITKRLFVETGIQYSQKGYMTIPILTVFNIEHNFEEAIATNYIYFTYLDIPLRGCYTFLNGKIQIVTSAGATFSFLLKVKGKSVPELPTEAIQTKYFSSDYEFSKMNISPTISAGIKYNVNSRINLRAEPTFRYGLINTDPKSYAFTHLWSAGLNISFNYGF